MSFSLFYLNDESPRGVKFLNLFWAKVLKRTVFLRNDYFRRATGRALVLSIFKHIKIYSRESYIRALSKRFSNTTQVLISQFQICWKNFTFSIFLFYFSASLHPYGCKFFITWFSNNDFSFFVITFWVTLNFENWQK